MHGIRVHSCFNRVVHWLLGIGLLACFAPNLGAQSATDTATDSSASAIVVTISGPIGPAVTEYLQDSLNTANEINAQVVVMALDTPGGLTEATRDIVKAMRASSIPIVVWVGPSGARAASAGTYMIYASHVAAMAPATNLGAATPVSIVPSAPRPDTQKTDRDKTDQADNSGEEGGTEQPSVDTPTGDASSRKAINDAAAWIRGLAQQTGRNEEWAQRAVTEGVSLTAQEALELGVIEIIAEDLQSLLATLDGREIQMGDETLTLATADVAIRHVEPGWRARLLAVITNPTFAYILLMIGIYGLLLEGYNPGTLVPGTVGAIALLTALYAFQVLPVNYAGLLLIILGTLLMVAESFAPSFGILGIGGGVAMVVGSVILMDTDAPGFQIALAAIVATAIAATLLLAVLIYLGVRTLRRPVVSGDAELLHARGEVLQQVDAEHGEVWIFSERWQARSDTVIEKGSEVRVLSRDGLTLHVAPVEAPSSPSTSEATS